jgi:hypothetical protein
MIASRRLSNGVSGGFGAVRNQPYAVLEQELEL